jgi:hypothetical protein
MVCINRLALSLAAAVTIGLIVLQPLSAATVAYWNAPTVSGSTLADLAGGDQDLVGSSGQMTPSAVDVAPLPVPNSDPVTTGASGSIYFNSGSEAPHTDSASVFQMTSTKSFTFEGWIQAQSGSTGYIASDRHRGTSYRGWFLQLQSSGSIQFYSNSGGTATTINSPIITDGGNHHFAAVWDHTDGVMSLYIDGDLEGGVSHSVGSYTPFGFSIGGRNTSSDNKFTADLLTAGTRLDEMRFSDAALAPTQFLNATGIPEPISVAMGLVGLTLVMVRRRA